MTYNTTFLNTSTSFVDIVTGLNTESNMLFALMILISLWIIVFIATKQFDTKVAFVSSNTIITVISVFMLSLGWINKYMFTFCLVLLMFSLIAYKFMD